ncbi:MAG: hypothetical protein KKA73_06820 [Chloroflexi bacterium]|nr:hypothetical protein [Chloroflexota bacterium]MBU1747385.1 hypothetical protein [Chloroflexota bacterium]
MNTQQWVSQAEQWITSQFIYSINGGLWIAYWLSDHIFLLTALGCMLVVLLVFDRQLQHAAHGRPLRHDRGTAPVVGWERHLMQLLTLIAGGLWIIAALNYASPVPQIGAGMWSLLVLILILVPAEREATQWRLKTGLILYTLLLLVLRWYLDLMHSVDAREWAAMLGSADEAQRVLAQNRSIVEMLGVFAIWFSGPVGFLAYAAQRLTTMRPSLEAPFQRAEDLVEAIRTRGERR